MNTKKLQEKEKALIDKKSEINIICNTSNIIGHSLNYHQIITIITNNINTVLNHDSCMIFLNTLNTNGDLFSILNTPLKKSLINTTYQQFLTTLSDISIYPPNIKKTNFQTQKNHPKNATVEKETQFNSLISIPLIFKNDIIGLYQLYSTKKNAFPKSKLPFLNIMTNQLANSIGRLKVIKELEKSKLSSLIHSITDGILILNKNHTTITVNDSASKLLNLNHNDINNTKKIIATLKKNKIYPLYQKTLTTKQPLLNQKINTKSQCFSLNITPIIDKVTQHKTTIFVFHDITELQKIDRIKTQRLEVISKINNIINSISDLTKLLNVLIDFILTTTNTQMGCIQLKKDKEFPTITHINFPEKTHASYKLKNGTLISNQVIKTKKMIYIKNYHESNIIQKSPQKPIKTYICLPIIVNKKLIGIINIAQDQKTNLPQLSTEDLLTLKTITTLSGTAIQNAQRYNETLNKQRIKEELKICKKIQHQLIPNKVPKHQKIEFDAISKPSREISGDYYDFINFKNGKIGIIIADIIGKGIPAGIFMAMLKTLLITETSEKKSPGTTLNKLNTMLIQHPIINKFIPLFYAILDPITLTLTYCNAGHEAPIWKSQKNYKFLNAQNLPIGAEKNKNYKSKKIQLAKNDILLLFTDGITEAKNKNNIPFGTTKIKKIITKNKLKTAKEITSILYGEVKKHTNITKQNDDITAITIKITP